MTDPTWTDIGAIAQAIVALTAHADLPHDTLVELAGPCIARLHAMYDVLLTDPHGDSDTTDDRPSMRPGGVPAFSDGSYDEDDDVPDDEESEREMLDNFKHDGIGRND